MNTIRHENTWPGMTEVVHVMDNGKGMVSCADDYQLTEGTIYNLVVHPSVRGRGIGNVLLRLAEGELKSRFGKSVAILGVVPGSWMEAWYRRHGYETYFGPAYRAGYQMLCKTL